MTDESKRSWESVPLLGGVLRERRRLRLVEAYQLVRAGTDPRGAAEATKLDAGTASHFAHLMTTLIAAETEVRNLHEFAHTLSPEKTTDGFRESLSAADRACSQLRAAAADGRVEDDSTVINVLKTSIWVASNNASKLRGSLERTERGYGLLSELRQEALRLLAILEDESLPCMDWLRAHLRDVLEAERMLGAVVERYGFTTATVEQITVRLVSLRSLDVPSLVRTTRESLERVSKAYLPAIASLERALASYVDDDDPACDTQLELETEERDAVVPDLQTHDAFVLHERAPYEHLCELILRARRMLGDGDQNPAEGERLDEEELLELCLQRAREACEDPYLSMEAQYCLAVAAVAEARLLQEQARDVEVAGQVLADFRDLDLVVRSERMSHFRELVTHEYLPVSYTHLTLPTKRIV